MTTFSADVVDAILHHMNDDHTDDGLAIVRAFAEPAATAVTMTGFDSTATAWDVSTGADSRSVTIAWLGPVVERADVRREIVHLYDEAVQKLGLPAREAH